jgi:hypothetical protein
MNNIVSSSLIHFTETLEYLQGIIKNGFRYSYCKEVYPIALVNNIINKDKSNFEPHNILAPTGVSGTVLIPMVSFCDIPLTRSKVHADKYGYYGVGIDRELARDIYPNLMPVQYVSSARYSLALNELSMLYSKSKETNRQIENSIKLIIGNTKGYTTLYEGQEVLCYEEREWRVIHSDDEHTPWGWGVNDKQSKDKYNERLHSISDLSYLSFIKIEDEVSKKMVDENIDKIITHIIVKSENEVQEIVKFILNEENMFFGYNLSMDSRLSLVSKINSFERISRDY